MMNTTHNSRHPLPVALLATGLLLSGALLAALWLSLAFSQPAAAGSLQQGQPPVSAAEHRAPTATFPITESFRYSTLADGWILGDDASLTALTGVDPNGDGWLRLTTKEYNKKGYAIYDRSFESTNGLAITFEYMSWGGTGADGLTFFLYDGNVGEPGQQSFNIGGYGGSLGYAQRSGFNGLSSGYVGIGIDEFGNFSNPTEGRIGGPGRVGRAVVVRGPGNGMSGYVYLTGVQASQRLDVPNVTTRPDINGAGYRKIQIDVTPTGTGSYTIMVKIQFGATGALQTIIGSYLLPNAPPETLKMGFAASTGGSTNYHEIRNLTVTAKNLPTILRGQVTDQTSSTPLPGATVVITDTGTPRHSYSTVAVETTGIYSFTASTENPINAGPVSMKVSTTGYCPKTLSTAVVEGVINVQNVALAPTLLSGVVTDQGTGVPIVGATVVLTDSVGTRWETTSGSGGAYSFSSTPSKLLRTGAATVRASKTNYQTQTATPTLTACNNTQNLALATADLLVLKTANRTLVYPDELISYTLTVRNQGSLIANSVILTDVLPSYTAYVSDTSGITPTENPTNTLRWSLGNLAIGEQKVFTLNARVAIPMPYGLTTLSNLARATTTSLEADLTNNQRIATTQVLARPDLTIFKSATADSVPIAASSTITYTYIGDNRGGAIATGVRITDTLDSNTTYVPGSAVLVVGGTTYPVTATYNSAIKQLLLNLPNMPPGAAGYLRYTATVTDTLPPGVTLITNTAEVTSAELDLDPADNISTLVLSAQAGADVYVQKNAFPTTIPALPGELMLYRLRYGNLGNEVATNTVLTDVIPANTSYVPNSLKQNGSPVTDGDDEDQGQYISASRVISFSLGDLAAGASGVISFTVRITDVLPAGVEQISNTAYITSSVGDPVLADNQSTAVMAVNAQPDLVIRKSHSGTYFEANQTVRYTLTYSNTGSQVASGVLITDTLDPRMTYVESAPPGIHAAGVVTWTLGEVAVDGPHAIVLTATVDASASGELTINRVEIDDDGAGGPDPDPSTNSAEDIVRIARPILVLEKSVAGQSYVSGQITYTIVYRNDGPVAARSVVISDVIPANTTLVAGSISGGGSANGGKVTWNLGNLGVGATGQVSFAVTVGVGAGGASQSAPTASSESASGSLVLTSTVKSVSSPWCFSAGCSTILGYWGDANPVGPAGWTSNPQLDGPIFDDSLWETVKPPATTEPYWLPAATLGAEWVAVEPEPQIDRNYSFFRQYFYLPPNARGFQASLQTASDDIVDIYVNGRYMATQYGAGHAAATDVSSAVLAGVNLLALRLTGSTHGGHPEYGGKDHPALLYRLEASFSRSVPFVTAPSITLEDEEVTFSMLPLLRGKLPFSYTISFGDNQSASYTTNTSIEHTYSTPGVYTAVVTARDGLGSLATDSHTITVLASGSNLLTNRATTSYQNGYAISYSGESGAGSVLQPVINIPLKISGTPNPVKQGNLITHTIVITNNGPTAASPIVSDTLPEELGSVTWQCVASSGSSCTTPSGSNGFSQTLTLQPGGIITITVVGTVAPTAGPADLVMMAEIIPPSGYTNLAEGLDVYTTPIIVGPTAVTMVSFAAERKMDHILVEWETASELDNRGFYLLRSTSSQGPPQSLAYIPSQSTGSPAGFMYEYKDYDVISGVTYWYWLEALDTDGSTQSFGPVSALFQTPLAVTLEMLSAVSQPDRVQIQWQTASELDNQGFHLLRSDASQGGQHLLAFIPAQSPGASGGFFYAYDDLDVLPGETYWYWLEAVALDGSVQRFGPVSARFDAPTAVVWSSFHAAAQTGAPAWLPALALLAAAAGASRLARQRLRD